MKIGYRLTMYLLSGALGLIANAAIVTAVQSANINNGENEFKEYCAACHADGGNIIKADKTLSRKDREKNGVNTAKDIVIRMRKPGEGMTTFDMQTISDKDAEAIAEYIIQTFK